MIKKFMLAFAALALATAAFAGSASSIGYKITLLRPSVVKGKVLKAGEYKLQILNEMATITGQQIKMDVPVKLETSEQKYPTTAVRYTEQDGKANISEIRIGGTKTKVLIN